MTTFKSNSKYAELVFTYLELAETGIVPLSGKFVLETFAWHFKGGSLTDCSQATRLAPLTSPTVFPDGLSWRLSEEWPFGQECSALRAIVRRRLASGKLRQRAVMARLGTLLALTASYGQQLRQLRIYSGMRAIYHVFALVWDWAERFRGGSDMELLEEYTRELLMATGAPSKVHIPTADTHRQTYWQILCATRLGGLLHAVRQVKAALQGLGSRQAMANARAMGVESRESWEYTYIPGCSEVRAPQEVPVRAMYQEVGPVRLRVFQGCALLGVGNVRHALSRSDLERLHQLIMSSASALVGVCAQAVVGTKLQRQKAALTVQVTERNIGRIVKSSQLVPLGSEVLVCKAYRRAYTAHLGYLAGPLCTEETRALVQEAKETAPGGVIDVDGMLDDARMLDAAGSLNATKMFKVCPAPDVSPGLAMMDRVAQIGDGNVVDSSMMVHFETELRDQILRAYIRTSTKRLELRSPGRKPDWYGDYRRGVYESVPTDDIHEYLAWEGTASMPEISKYDPRNWKDSGIGADTIGESEAPRRDSRACNMITRLIFDDSCPMPGHTVLTEDRVIKMFIKAEGHKDPARAIFSANLGDRQIQSWMEKAVESVAKAHPSFMIGQELDVRDSKITQLTSLPTRTGWVAMYYSFDISGWSGKMPAEPQHISHKIWGDLFGGHIFRTAHLNNEGAHIYMDLDGYTGWYKNTHSNLEGFNGKEMTMVLIALLSLSVRRWRTKVVEAGIMREEDASQSSVLLFAYIDDGLSRLDLPRSIAVRAFSVYKETVIETFSQCGFSVEVTKCFPSDCFAIFLNEVYLGGRHVVHGVRAAMGISAEPTERHTSLVERVSSVSTGVRGAVMAGLNPLCAAFLLAYHALLHLQEWTSERDPVVLATWSVTPRAWGGLGMPNMLQMYVSGSGSAFEEGAGTLQAYARLNTFAKKVFLRLCRTPLADRSALSILTAPLSGRVEEGYMVDSRLAGLVRSALGDLMHEGRLSQYANRLLKYSDSGGFDDYAEAVVPVGVKEVLQEQMLDNVANAHPHSIFAAFARRLDKSATVRQIIGQEMLNRMIALNRLEADDSVAVLRKRSMW